jgi:hypothetical protein
MSYTQPGDGTFNTVLAGFSTVKFTTNQIERMRIDASGNVSIGTQSPSVPLTVKSRSADNIGVRVLASPSNVGAILQFTDDPVTVEYGSLIATSTYLLANSSTEFRVQTNNFERMRLTTAGNLLLGTTASPTTGEQCLTIETSTAPTATPADTISIYSSDLSAGNTILSIYTEGT